MAAEEEEKGSLSKETPKKSYAELRKLIWAASFFSGIGIYLAVVVGMFLWLGDWADGVFDSSPKGRLAGILIAFPVAVYSIYKKIRFFW